MREKRGSDVMVAMRVLEARAERRESSSLSSRTKICFTVESDPGNQKDK